MIQVHDVQLPRAARSQLARARAVARERFMLSRRAEGGFLRNLRAVSRQIGALSKGMEDHHALVEALKRYSGLLRPWALSVVQRMQHEVNRRDVQAWEALAGSMGRTLRKEIEGTPLGRALYDKLAEDVDLITSLPLRAAERVQKLASQMVLEATRAKELQKEILRSGQVSAAHAMTIARTEVSRNASLITQLRAEHIGSPGYFWRSSEDASVRPLHRKLDGKFIPWNQPPVAGENGERYHAGQGFN